MESPGEDFGGAAVVPSLKNFLALNPGLEEMKKKRDEVHGFRRYLYAILFAYVLISPMLAFIPTVNDKGYLLAIVLCILGLILLYYIEFAHRAEIWYTCVSRGILVEFRNTHELKQWFFHPVVLTSVVFILFFAVIIGITYDGSLWEKIVTGVLMALALAFVFSTCRDIITLQEGHHLLTLNLVQILLDDRHLLSSRGFKTIHQSQLIQWYKDRKKNKVEKTHFSWDELYALDHTQVPEPKLINLMRYMWGIRISTFLKRFKDSEQ